MSATPPKAAAVLPVLAPIVGPLWSGLRAGTDYASDQQPDPEARNPWFFADCARFKALITLQRIPQAGWVLRPGVPNYGIHLRVGDLHLVRVLRSFDGSTPHPGSNPRRRQHYQQFHQPQLALATSDNLPPLNLIIDWHVEAGEPILNLSLPYRPWDYQSNPQLHWRVPFPDLDEFQNLAFAGDEGEEVEARLKVHESEMRSV